MGGDAVWRTSRLVAILGIAAAVLSAEPERARAQLPPLVGCAISRTPSLAFGEYVVTKLAPTDTTGQLQLTCQPISIVRLHLSQGNSATFNPRRMQSGSSVLQYNVYIDEGHSRIWGDGSGGTEYVTFAFQLFPTFTLYARIPAQQKNLGTGAYSDRLRLTVLY